MPSCTLPYKTLQQLSHWMKKFLSTLSRGFLFPHSWQAFILTFNVPVFLFLLVLLVLLVVVHFYSPFLQQGRPHKRPAIHFPN
jgi:hypothetical protein